MIKRVFSLASFSFAALLFFGCGGSPDQVANNNNVSTSPTAKRNAAAVKTEPRKSRARPPIEARKNSQITTKSERSGESRKSELAPADDNRTTESDVTTGDEADSDAAEPTEPIKTAAPKKTSAKKNARPKIGELGASSAASKIPAMAEPTGKEGIKAGDTVIEIEGKDIDGESFALSDYSGKVIMLDFWGDW